METAHAASSESSKRNLSLLQLTEELGNLVNTCRIMAALRLLMLIGCWRNKILRLRWEELALERSELRLSDSKPGPRTMALSPAAARVLANRPRASGDP